jgi:hypothetical protein
MSSERVENFAVEHGHFSEYWRVPIIDGSAKVFVVVGHSWGGQLKPPAAFITREAAEHYIETHKHQMNLSDNGNKVWVQEVPLQNHQAEVDWT